MNFAIVRYLIGWMLGIESIFLLLPALTARHLRARQSFRLI